MNFGLFNLMTLRDHPKGVAGIVDDTRSMVKLAEDIGFSIAWFAEHHFTNYSVSVSPLMMAAHMAGISKRIRLGAGVVVLPLYHPLRVAQEIALLDQQSGGRAVLGIGTGYQKYEFERFGLPVEEKTDIFLEYWSVVERALADGRVKFSGKSRTVVDGPFAETKELIAGYCLWQCKSMDEAIEWVKRCPNPMLSDSEIEIRQIFSAEDFGEAFTPELREQEERLRRQAEQQQQQ